MATSNLYRVVYQVVKVSGGGAGQKYLYRKPPQSAYVACTTSGGATGILATLIPDVALAAGESVELISYQQEQGGDGVLYS